MPRQLVHAGLAGRGAAHPSGCASKNWRACLFVYLSRAGDVCLMTSACPWLANDGWKPGHVLKHPINVARRGCAEGVVAGFLGPP